VFKLDVYNVFYAYKRFGEGVGGEIALCKSPWYFKIHLAIKVYASKSDKGFDIKFIDFVM
jgi:hypothetical protein